MDKQQIVEDCKKHTFYSWSVQGKVDPLAVASSEGIYMTTPNGRKIIDFNSQLMSVNVGHGHPKVLNAMKAQIDKLCYVHPGTATQIRAEVGKLLAQICPGDLNTFFFTLGGAESNENAIKLARLFTGRKKILARHRSYHGATHACMALSGDPRRWANEPALPGVVHVMHPTPYKFSFGNSAAEINDNYFTYLEEIIQSEGKENIAAMFIEAVTGTNGIVAPPEGHLKKLKALLDHHGILLICDEVMAGFGRTGKMFSFMHGDIVPDIVCMAKGLTSSYAPLGAVGMSDRIAKHFENNMFWGGLTYSAHCLGLSAAKAVIEVLLEEKLVERAAEMQPIMRKHLSELKQKYPCVKTFRNIGLFSMVDLQTSRNGTDIAGYNENSPIMAELKKYWEDNGLFTFTKWGSFMCNPPLCITEEQLADSFKIIGQGLNDVIMPHFSD